MTEADHGHPHPGKDGDDGLSYYARRARAIEALLVAKGICTAGEVKRAVEQVETRSPADGARVVAHAWVEAGFKTRLLSDPKSALADLGYTLPDTTQLTVVENNPQVHHLVVCTLCSCYPRTLLGRPPDWYKSLAYRSRAVVDPRGVMREFGLELDDRVTVRVLDSTADMRYLVLPRRPAGAEGMNEEQLAKLVTRDSMIGAADALSPASVASST
jgi:nitrile hydratase